MEDSKFLNVNDLNIKKELNYEDLDIKMEPSLKKEDIDNTTDYDFNEYPSGRIKEEENVNINTKQEEGNYEDVTIKEEELNFMDVEKMEKNLLKDDHMIAAVLDELPSDYEADTEEEEDDEYDFSVEDPLTKSIGESLTDKEELLCDNAARRYIIILNESENAKEEEATAEEKEDNLPVSTKAVIRKWKKKEEATKVCDFNIHQGVVNQNFSDCKNADDFFLKFFDDELINHICYQTNLYATQNSKTLAVSEQEMITFLGVNMFMGYVRLPSYRHYWSQSLDIRYEFVSNHMTRDRFTAILSHLHLNDNSVINDHKGKKLYKIEPFVTKLKEKFKNLYHPRRELCIGESMILFKGRSSLKQYNPMKPIKSGYKIWCLGDSTGYISNFEIYCGKSKDAENGYKEIYGLGGSVVLNLTKEFFGKGYFIYFDNYFSSFPLLEKLKINHMYACGTIRNTRKGFPELANDKSLQRGQFDFRSTSEGITTYKWKDTKPVYLVSNFHGIETTFVKRTLKDGTKSVVSCPQIVADYNKFMGGIDKHDMLRNIYCVNRKSKKWWHRLFFGLMDMALVNAYVAYCEMNETVPMLEFRRMVCRGLITKGATARTDNKKRKIQYSVSSEIRMSNLGVHWVAFSESRGRCNFCSKHNNQSKPFSYCSFCKVHLCSNKSKNCFAEYHGITI